MPEPVSSVLDLIGSTPVVRLRSFDTGPCELHVKLESQNPGGSIKDRIGLAMIRAAEASGALGSSRRHLVEATAGNTGLGLALVAAQRGYKLTLASDAHSTFDSKVAKGADIAAIINDTTRGSFGRAVPAVMRYRIGSEDEGVVTTGEAIPASAAGGLPAGSSGRIR